MFGLRGVNFELSHFKPYDFRHMYASLLLSQRVPLVYVFQQLGHVKPTTILEHYTSGLPSGNRRYAVVLDQDYKKPGTRAWRQR